MRVYMVHNKISSPGRNAVSTHGKFSAVVDCLRLWQPAVSFLSLLRSLICRDLQPQQVVYKDFLLPKALASFVTLSSLSELLLLKDLSRLILALVFCPRAGDGGCP